MKVVKAVWLSLLLGLALGGAGAEDSPGTAQQRLPSYSRGELVPAQHVGVAK